MSRDVEYGYNPNVGLNGLVSIIIPVYKFILGQDCHQYKNIIILCDLFFDYHNQSICHVQME